jgi:uncharacterized protein (TIGR03437 family)
MLNIARRWAWAVLCLSAAWAQAPSYSSTSILNASDYTAGPFAPNSVLSLFGTDLSRSTAALSPESVAAGKLPSQLAATAVYVDDSPAPLLFVSPGQINFLIPSDQIAGKVTVRVARQSVTGAPVTINLVDAAPALFADTAGYAIAEDWNANSSLVTADAPARPGDMVVLFVTGLGSTEPSEIPGQIPMRAAYITARGLGILLNGTPIDPSLIRYAGVTPGCAGLYQINMLLPLDPPADPEIRVTIGDRMSAAGVKLAVAPAPASDPL